MFREDIGQSATLPELEGLRRKRHQFKLKALKNTCRQYIQSTIAQQIGEVVRATLVDSNIDMNVPSVDVDTNDPDGQSPLFWYPSVTVDRDSCIRPAAKIESGAKSALDPHEDLSIVPYVSD